MTADLGIWLAHFDYHAQHRRGLALEIPGGLSVAERCAIARSLAIFQLGERSDGESLRRAARRFEADCGAAPLARIIDLLIREEQHHAALLREFMASHGIAPRRRHWTDWVFRRLRHAGGFERHLAVLLCAELIGHTYYRALEEATACPRLRLLCRRLVADELAHVAFEADLLLALRARRTAAGRHLAALAHRALFTLTAVVAWSTHRAVFRRAGYGLPAFLHSCRSRYAFYLESPPILAESPADPCSTADSRLR